MNTPIIFMGSPWVPTTGGGTGVMPPFDWSDVMLKSTYDTDYDGSVEKIDTLSGIQDLGPSLPNKVIKTNDQNQPYWGEDESSDDVDGGVIL